MTVGCARQQSRDIRLCGYDSGNPNWRAVAEQSVLQQRLVGLPQCPHLCSSRISPQFSLNLSRALATALVSSSNRCLGMHGANDSRLCPATESRYSAVLSVAGAGSICADQAVGGVSAL